MSKELLNTAIAFGVQKSQKTRSNANTENDKIRDEFVSIYSFDDELELQITTTKGHQRRKQIYEKYWIRSRNSLENPSFNQILLNNLNKEMTFLFFQI